MKAELSTPTPISCFTSVTAVECGSSVSYALTQEGKGYAWGMGTCYQLTTGLFFFINATKLVNILSTVEAA